jgi:hypothetical protein
MSDTVGRIPVASTSASQVFPLVTEFPHGRAQKRLVITHEFGSANAKIEQRFYVGSPATRYTFKSTRLTASLRLTLRNFWEARQGAAGAFFYDVPNEDQTFTRKTVCFENQPLTFEELSDSICGAGVVFVEIPDPDDAPVYSLGAIVSRFPNHTLTDALLDQVQEIIPLVRIRVLDAEVPDILLSDRRVTIRDSRGEGDPVDSLYLPRLLRVGEPGGGALVTQSIDGSSDDVTFSFGNADRVMVRLANDTQLRWARIELSLYHVGSTVRLDLWAGYIIDWASDAGPEMSVKASDILSALTLSSPVNLVSRTCWRRLGQDGCQWDPDTDTRDLVHFPDALTTKCDLGYNTPNGCLAHGLAVTAPGYGATYCSPQAVLLRSGGIGLTFPGFLPIIGGPLGTFVGSVSTWYPRTSLISDTIYGQNLPEIWHDDDGQPQNALPVTCKVAAGRDEDQFYIALGIVGKGPLGAFTAPQMYDSNADAVPDAFAGSTLDGQPNHGFQVTSAGVLKPGAVATFGLRQVLGSDPAGEHDYFSLGRVSATGVGWFQQPSDNSWMKEVAYASSAYNLVFAAGVAFCEIRRVKPNSDPLTSPGQHTMVAAVSQGLTALAWTGPGARTTIPGCTNPFWVAVNTFLSAVGVLGLDAEAQEELFDVPSAVAAAAVADITVTRIIGTGSEIQFRFKGTIDDRKPTRDWLQAILNSASGYYVWSFGKLKVGCRENASAASAFTTGNMLLDSLHLSPIKPQFEKLTLSFADQEYQFQSNTIDLTDQDHAARNKRSQNPLAATFPLSGCSTKSQAARLAIVREREELGGITQAEQDGARVVSLKTTILALETEAGMVVSVEDPDMPGAHGTCDVSGTAVAWANGDPFDATMVGRAVLIGGLRVLVASVDMAHQTLVTDTATFTGSGQSFHIATGHIRIQRWALNRDWSIDIQGQSVTASMYDTTVGPKPADVVASPIPGEPAGRVWDGLTFTAAVKNAGWITADNIALSIPGSYPLTGINFYVVYVDELTADCYATTTDAVDSGATDPLTLTVIPNPGQTSDLAFVVGDWIVWNDAGKFEIGQLTVKAGDVWTIQRHYPGELAGCSTFEAPLAAHDAGIRLFKGQVRQFLSNAKTLEFTRPGDGVARFDMALPSACVVAIVAAPFTDTWYGTWVNVNCASETVPGLRTCVGGEFSFQTDRVYGDPGTLVAKNNFSVDLTQPQRVNFCYTPEAIAADDLVVNVRVTSDGGATWTTLETLTIAVGETNSWPGESPPAGQQTPYSGTWPFRIFTAGERLNFTIESGATEALTVKLDT